MEDKTITDRSTDADREPAKEPVSLRAGLGLSVIVACLLAGAAWSPDILEYVNAARQADGGSTQTLTTPRKAEIAKVAAMTVDDTRQIIVEGGDAVARNEAIPLYARAVEKARGFSIGKDDPAYRTALKCMTQAIYYEAAVEPMEGRRAVAQVILNRLRHPAYPSSVCGVVYQGAQRRTGCQFSFTCDGSLLRQPSARGWREAEQVATAALAGHTEASVGTATHYHADYVLPKWAFELGKVEKLGRHIFYRFRGGWGQTAHFTSRYLGSEYIPSLNFAALRERANGRENLAHMGETVPGLTVTPHVTDRHAPSDVGGRIDVNKPWRLTIPDPVEASSRYRDAVAGTSELPKPVAEKGRVALASEEGAAVP